jgi:biofilm PGA synthesis lipoprotein PgaB
MWRALAFSLACLPGIPALAARVPVLVYHDIARRAPIDQYAVTETQFREQMAFLQREGYRPISLNTFIEASRGRAPLPDKAVLLSFDDGLASFADLALPLLEQYGFPAVLSVTTGWLMGESVPDAYRNRLLTPEALRKLSRSPWVEVLSHSDHLHEGIPGDPQGSDAPAGITRRYTTQGYESEAAYRIRIRSDLRTSVERIGAITGRRPRGIAWPYGLYNAVLAEEAAALGMEAQLALDDRAADSAAYPRISRLPLRRVRTLADFEEALRPNTAPVRMRILEIPLDDIARAAPSAQDALLRQTAERARLLRANMAIVHPFSADGREAHFSNPVLPYRADILHRALHLLRTGASVRWLILSVPASVTADAVHAELARRHPCDGLLLAGRYPPERLAALKARFAYYRPELRCGVDAVDPDGVCGDFRLVAVDPRERDSSTDSPGHARTPVYYLVRNGKGDGSIQVAEAMRRLRGAGALHYGVMDEGPLREPEGLRRVAIEFNRFVYTGPGS